MLEEEAPMDEYRGSGTGEERGKRYKQQDSRRPLLWCFIASHDDNNWQMAIAGVEGNITYTTTCLERERQEEEELNQQV